MSERTQYRSIAAVLALLILVVSACDSNTDSDDGTDDFDRQAMLTNIADNSILPAYEALALRVSDLDASVQAFQASPDGQSLDQARSALKQARLAWQDANLFQFGPAESATLRSAVNTYPVDTDQVDANIASGSYTLGSIQNRAAAGFPAMGYLLYGDGATDTEIVDAFTTSANASARMDYLVANVEFVDAAVRQVVDAWRPGGGDYRTTFLSPANAGTDVGSSLGMMINALALHYERFLRDGKIGIPSGVRSAGVPRPMSTEAYHAGYSAELAVANTAAVKRLFLGNSLSGATGSGLDDHLAALGANDLAVEIDLELSEAVTAVASLEDPLSEQIETNNAPVLEAFTAMQDAVVILKADMTSILGITITFQDNDGD